MTRDRATNIHRQHRPRLTWGLVRGESHKIGFRRRHPRDVVVASRIRPGASHRDSCSRSAHLSRGWHRKCFFVLPASSCLASSSSSLLFGSLLRRFSSTSSLFLPPLDPCAARKSDSEERDGTPGKRHSKQQIAFVWCSGSYYVLGHARSRSPPLKRGRRRAVAARTLSALAPSAPQAARRCSCTVPARVFARARAIACIAHSTSCRRAHGPSTSCASLVDARRARNGLESLGQHAGSSIGGRSEDSPGGAPKSGAGVAENLAPKVARMARMSERKVVPRTCSGPSTHASSRNSAPLARLLVEIRSWSNHVGPKFRTTLAARLRDSG